MEHCIIRTAAPEDASCLAEIKSRYVRALYRGFVPAGYLKQVDETFYLSQILRWIQGDKYTVAVMELDHVPAGFIVYGRNAQQAGHGLIREIAILPTCGPDDRNTLVNSGVSALSASYDVIHLWVVRDNFRVRFHFEQLGFRPDEQTRMIVVQDPTTREPFELQVSHYMYRVR